MASSAHAAAGPLGLRLLTRALWSKVTTSTALAPADFTRVLSDCLALRISAPADVLAAYSDAVLRPLPLSTLRPEQLCDVLALCAQFDDSADSVEKLALVATAVEAKVTYLPPLRLLAAIDKFADPREPPQQQQQPQHKQPQDMRLPPVVAAICHSAVPMLSAKLAEGGPLSVRQALRVLRVLRRAGVRDRRLLATIDHAVVDHMSAPATPASAAHASAADAVAAAVAAAGGGLPATPPRQHAEGQLRRRLPVHFDVAEVVVLTTAFAAHNYIPSLTFLSLATATLHRAIASHPQAAAKEGAVALAGVSPSALVRLLEAAAGGWELAAVRDPQRRNRVLELVNYISFPLAAAMAPASAAAPRRGGSGKSEPTVPPAAQQQQQQQPALRFDEVIIVLDALYFLRFVPLPWEATSLLPHTGDLRRLPGSGKNCATSALCRWVGVNAPHLALRHLRGVVRSLRSFNTRDLRAWRGLGKAVLANRAHLQARELLRLAGLVLEMLPSFTELWVVVAPLLSDAGVVRELSAEDLVAWSRTLPRSVDPRHRDECGAICPASACPDVVSVIDALEARADALSLATALTPLETSRVALRLPAASFTRPLDDEVRWRIADRQATRFPR